MRYAEIKPCDIANGTGVRVSLFVSGCTHHCKGCFNQIAWDFGYGQVFDGAAEDTILSLLSPDYIAGLSLLGGEPFEADNQRGLLPLLRRVRKELPQKNVWCYSGYLWEELAGRVPCPARCEATDELLSLIDVLVDGEYVEAEADISLLFRGSRNQRILDLPATLRAGKPVLSPLNR